MEIEKKKERDGGEGKKSKMKGRGVEGGRGLRGKRLRKDKERIQGGVCVCVFMCWSGMLKGTQCGRRRLLDFISCIFQLLAC